MHKFYKFVTINYGKLITVLCIVFAIGTVLLIKLDFSGKTDFWGGFWTEVCVGGLFSTVAVLFSSYIFLMARRQKFYEDIVEFIEELKDKRENGKIDGVDAQQIVIKFSKTIPDEIIAYSLEERIESDHKLTGTKCAICNQAAIKKKNRCSLCNLNCQAWEVKK